MHLSSESPLLEVRAVTHRYGPAKAASRRMPVLESLDLEVASEQITVLLGPSGCGKTTLLHLAAGLVPVQTGEIRLKGRVLRGPDPSVGVVFQQPALLPWLSVQRNVAFGLSLRHSEPLTSQQRRQRIEEALDLVGLREHAALAPAQLSGGMAQRAALARVLVRHPRLLLLDEPFSALDAVTRSEMQQLVRSIVRRTGTGVLLITHDVDEALALGDRVLLMHRHPGRIHRRWELRERASPTQNTQLKEDILLELGTILNPALP